MATRPCASALPAEAVVPPPAAQPGAARRWPKLPPLINNLESRECSLAARHRDYRPNQPDGKPPCRLARGRGLGLSPKPANRHKSKRRPFEHATFVLECSPFGLGFVT